MLHASTKKLIDRLAEMTELAKLDWTEGDDGNITYSTEGYSVALTETPNEMVITSKDGKELERASADELATTHSDDGTPYAQIVADMTREAARVARGTEAAISTLLAGMQDAPTTGEAEATEEEATEVELQEDPGDETAVLADETVEVASADAKQDDVAIDDDSADSEDEPAVLAQEEGSEPTEPDLEDVDAADEHLGDVVLEAAGTEEANAAEEDTSVPAASEAQTETESEDDVTEAVARMADEVNQREENGLDAAAASAVGAVALAAGLTPETEHQEEPIEEAAAEHETELSVDASPIADVESAPEPYVPFGLETENEPEESVAPAGTLTAEEAVQEETSTSEPILVAETEAETETETQSPDSIALDSDTVAGTEAPDPFQSSTTWTGLGVASTTASDSNTEISEAPEEATEAVAASDTTPDEAPIIVDDEPAPVAAEETAEPEPVLASATEETPPEPKSYSLSGIGAGFGLGALSAKTEASGVPGPSGVSDVAEEKVIIDATEDVLPEIDGKPALPPSVAPLPPAASADEPSEAQAEPELAGTDSDILKPRTRFNPWD